MRYIIINYFGKKIFQSREKWVNNCFKPLISPVFTTVAYRLKSEQKVKEKQILALVVNHNAL